MKPPCGFKLRSLLAEMGCKATLAYEEFATFESSFDQAPLRTVNLP